MIPAEEVEDERVTYHERRVEGEAGRAELDGLVEEGNRLESDLNARDSELFRLRQELHDLKSSLAGKSQYYEVNIREVERARAEEDELRNHLADLENEIKRINDERASVQVQITDAESRIDENDKDLQSIIERIRLIQKEIWEQDNLNRELHYKLNDRAREANVTFKTLYSARKRLLEEEAERGNKQLEILRTLYEKLVAERADKAKAGDADARYGKIKSLEDLIKGDIQEMKDLDEKRKNLYTQVDQEDRELKIKLRDLVLLKSKKESLEKEEGDILELLRKHIQRDEKAQSELDQEGRIKEIKLKFLSKLNK